jgi:3',5'-cyclic-nucleotide phosphodiesterase
VFTGDTAPTQKIWDEVNKEKNIKAIITEVSYPDCALKIANISRHMTSTLFREELKKIADSSIPVFIYHMKPQHIDNIKKEIQTQNNLNVHYLEQGRSYIF